MREDGLRIDRLLLTTDTTFIPTGFGPPETDRQLGSGGLVTPLTRTIVYTYDNLYRLTEADYTSGESYAYSYDSVGNRLQQIIDGDTTTYQYDAANRLDQVTVSGQSPVSYTFDDNGNLLAMGVMTNTWDTANRLVTIQNPQSQIQNRYNGVGDRVGQTTSITTTYFALDVMGLPEVIYTTEGNLYLHLPGVIMAESGTGEIRYLLSDGLGSVRQAVDESGDVVVYQEFDPYGNPLQSSSVSSQPYGFTGEWWEGDVGLLHLRARWYAPEAGTFLSVDPVESEPPYQYVRGNVVNRIDPSGMIYCDPVTGYCQEIDRYLCSHTPGAYDHRMLPCIVDPNNVNTEGPWPILIPSNQSSITPLPTSIQDDRDLTTWLYTELKAGIMNIDVNFVKELNVKPYGKGTLVGTGSAGVYWQALVRNKARYDFKHKIRDEMQETILFYTNRGDPIWSEFSVPGNIFFGYVGSYVGFPGTITHLGAGLAQLKDQIKKINNICDIPRYIPPSTVWYLGDSPADYQTVQFGIDLWKKHGANLNLIQLRDEIEQNHHKFSPPPALPGNGSIPPYGWRNPVGGWPYWIGRFNGEDEHRHWPPSPENGFGFWEF